jgi:hypothetical protein
MMTIEKQRDTDRRDNYKCYKIKCSVTDSTTRIHTRHGNKPFQKYAILVLGLETMWIERESFARMLKRIRADNRENYKKTA